MTLLTPELAQRLDFCKACYLQGLCTEDEYQKARFSIYQEAIQDLKTDMIDPEEYDQTWEKQEYGEMAQNIN